MLYDHISSYTLIFSAHLAKSHSPIETAQLWQQRDSGRQPYEGEGFASRDQVERPGHLLWRNSFCRREHVFWCCKRSVQFPVAFQGPEKQCFLPDRFIAATVRVMKARAIYHKFSGPESWTKTNTESLPLGSRFSHTQGTYKAIWGGAWLGR